MARVVREREEAWGPFTGYVQPEWKDAYPWLTQGLTGRAGDGPAGAGPGGLDPEAWARALRPILEVAGVVRLRQVHGAAVHVVGGAASDSAAGAAGAAGTPESGDALLTAAPNTALAVFVADCVPVFLLDPGRRAAGIVHAGWRGAAAGVLEAATRRFGAALGSRAADLHLHLGVAICGRCYEVGPEVTEALGLPSDGRKTHVDLRDALEARAVRLGVPASAITRSPYCTRCDRDRFYSYRGEGKRAGRMAAVVALSARDPTGR